MRSAARNRISLIAPGHASASTQICMSMLSAAGALPLRGPLCGSCACSLRSSLRLGLQRAADLQLLARDAHLLQLAEHFLRHAFRQIDEAVIVADHDAADVLAVEAGFVGDRADDVAGLDAVCTGRLRRDTSPSSASGASRAVPGDLSRSAACRRALRSDARACSDSARCSLARERARGGSRWFAAFGRASASARVPFARRVASPRAAASSNSGVLPCAMLASAAAISTAGTLCSRSYCSISARNASPSPAASASVMRSVKRATRCSFTSSMRRQLHRLDGLARRALDHAQHVALARRDEQDRLAAAAGAAGAADAMHVRFRVVRHVEVDDVADALDVEAARGDVGRHDDVDLAGLEPRDRALALRLRDVAVERLDREAARLEPLGQLRRRDAWCARTPACASNGSASRMRVSASSLCMPLTIQ